MLMRAHPGDHLLLLAMDGALSRTRRARIESHVAACAACQARLQRLESMLADVSHACRLAGETASGPAGGRLRLEQALRQAGHEWDQSWWARWRHLPMLPDALTMAIAASLVAVVVAWVAGNGAPPPWAQNTLANPGGPLPVAALTPGAVSMLTAAELCAGTRTSRIVTDDVRRRVLAEYGMTFTPADAYELDALVTPELGGTTARENLWPQRYGSPVWNAHVKDALERLFAEKVCHDEMALAQAQQEMAADWVAAYKRHFHTDIPIAAHARATSVDDDLQYESLWLPDRREHEGLPRRHIQVQAATMQVAAIAVVDDPLQLILGPPLAGSEIRERQRHVALTLVRGVVHHRQ